MNKGIFSIVDAYLNYPYKKKGKNKTLYISKDKQSDHPDAITYDEYKLIVETYNQIASELILKGFQVKLPAGLGVIYVTKWKGDMRSTKKLVDWKKTNELYGEYNKTHRLKKFATYDNAHTDGYNLTFKWKKTKGFVKYASFYSFYPIKAVKYKLRDLVREDSTYVYNFS